MERGRGEGTDLLVFRVGRRCGAEISLGEDYDTVAALEELLEHRVRGR